MVRNTSCVHVRRSLQCVLSVSGRFTLSFYIYIQVHLCHAGRAYLIYWEEEDSVSVTRRDNMVEQVCEPAGGDVMKIKFQCQVYKGTVAEVGTPEAIKSKEETFLRGVYAPFFRKQPASPPSELTSAKKSKVDKENVTPQRSGRERGWGRGKRAQAEIEEPRCVVKDMVGWQRYVHVYLHVCLWGTTCMLSVYTVVCLYVTNFVLNVYDAVHSHFHRTHKIYHCHW